MHSKEPVDFILPMIKTPHILQKALGSMFTKHFKAPRELKRGDGISKLPIQQISMKIINACNLRCKTCGQWGETGYNFDKPTDELKKIIPVERYLEIADEVKKDKPIYYIWGGEPFLYPGIMDLTARIKENKSVLALVTNATFLERYAKEIVEQGWDALMFSLDGDEAIHDEIRGKKGTFAKMRAGIEAVQKYKKDMGKSLPYLMPLVTVSVSNADKLYEIFDVARQLNTDCVVVYYSWFTNEKIGNAYSKIMKEKMGVDATSWQGYLFDHNVDTQKLIESKNRIRAEKWPFPILYIPDLADNQLETYYKEPGNFFGFGPCISPWMTVELMPNGDVAACRDYPDFVAGNIENRPLYDVWNDEPFVKFRKTLLEHGGTFPICSRCCGLMGW